jgi:hypothetical protein
MKDKKHTPDQIITKPPLAEQLQVVAYQRK